MSVTPARSEYRGLVEAGEEDTPDEPEELDIADAGESSAAPSVCFLLALNSFAFSYGLTATTLGLVILPSEAVHLYPERHALMLGLMLGCTGITQLIGPAIGYTSDRSQSRCGRRRPVMVLGALLAIIGNAGMAFCHLYRIGRLYIVSLTLCVFGMNCCYASYTALLPDFVPLEHMGQASGIMASMTMLGSFVGFALFGFYLSVEHAYPVYASSVVGTILITCCAAREKVIKRAPPVLCSELVSAYSIDAVAYPDFFWVFITRTFYYMGLSIQAFVLFMLRDVQKVSDPKYHTSMLAMVGQLAALLVAVPAGRLSDRLGRKPLVYASCALMAVSYCGFACAPGMTAVLWLTVGGGVGNGMFLSVDYALACDVLPSLEEAAQNLGVWGVSAFLGSTIGPLIAGPLLTHFGSTSSTEEYSTPGYVAVMLLGAVYVICAGLMLRTVQAR